MSVEYYVGEISKCMDVNHMQLILMQVTRTTGIHPVYIQHIYAKAAARLVEVSQS